MAVITDYTSLVAAINNYVHRDLTASVDLFIQAATEQIQQDIPDQNFGNYIRPMEVGYGPVTLQGGITPVPTDWLGAKIMTVSDGNSDTWPLLMKAASWLYTRYPVRQPTGLPAYIARDVMASASFTASLTANVLTVTAMTAGSNPIQRGMIVQGTGVVFSIANATIVTSQLTGTTGGIGTYSVSGTTSAGSEAMTGGGEIFVYGPYPDSNYTIAGTYYGVIPLLTSGASTNWLTSKAPALLQAACMVEAAIYVADDAMLTRWSSKYQEKLKALVDMDKAERWAAGTLALEIA